MHTLANVTLADYDAKYGKHAIRRERNMQGRSQESPTRVNITAAPEVAGYRHRKTLRFQPPLSAPRSDVGCLMHVNHQSGLRFAPGLYHIRVEPGWQALALDSDCMCSGAEWTHMRD